MNQPVGFHVNGTFMGPRLDVLDTSVKSDEVGGQRGETRRQDSDRHRRRAGIGRAIAIEYAREGANVVVASRTACTVDAVVDEIAARAAATRSVVTCDVG